MVIPAPEPAGLAAGRPLNYLLPPPTLSPLFQMLAGTPHLPWQAWDVPCPFAAALLGSRALPTHLLADILQLCRQARPRYNRPANKKRVPEFYLFPAINLQHESVARGPLATSDWKLGLASLPKPDYVYPDLPTDRFRSLPLFVSSLLSSLLY